MDEMDLYKALGVTPTAATSDKPDESQTDDNQTDGKTEGKDGDGNTEGKDGGTEGKDGKTDDTKGDGETGTGDGENNSGRDRDKDAKFAAARRKAEAEAAAETERLKLENAKAMDELIRGMNIKNPISGKPITTKAEYDAYKLENEVRKTTEAIKSGKMSGDDFAKLIEEKAANSDEVVEAKRVLEEKRRDAARAKINAELAEIADANPAVKTFDDIKNLDRYPEISEQLAQGIPLSVAYFYVYRDAMKAEAEVAKGAAKAALAKEAGKAHLQKTKSVGAGETVVPKEVIDEYRAFMPNITDEEIIKHYSKYKKS